MDLKEQFRYEDFCLKFARFLLPVIGADEIIAQGKFTTKLYRKCSKLYLMPEDSKINGKADVCFRIGCEFNKSYTLYGETFKEDMPGCKDAYPVFCTEPFKIVVRKDIRMGEMEIIKHMKETFKANVLYLVRYTGLYGGNEDIKRFRKNLLKEKIYLVFYHEMNQAKSLSEDFGVLV